ncbi:MAG: hypothetical protein L6435_17995, partial [Anaerolineae bacterium]|nr:hypothetical protein [Anaerolineae bacterium]
VGREFAATPFLVAVYASLTHQHKMEPSQEVGGKGEACDVDSFVFLDLRQFCGTRWLWYNALCEFSVLSG